MFKRNDFSGSIRVLEFKEGIDAFNVGGGCNPYTSGYGSKIRSDWMVSYSGRMRRVYVICYSNSGTLYINHDGDTVVVNIEGK